jgi:CDP-diacylglycerol--glycerol-3-phosphate 3-phosphatidyltransferase
MTVPNIISIFRLLLIPAFVMSVLYYVDGVKEGQPDDMLRWWAAAIFIVAALSDGVDGYIARRFNQSTELGAVLDPIADKLLQVTALVLLSLDFHQAFHRLPIWLPILVISRDVLILVGFLVIKLVVGVKVELRTHWSGKLATALLMVLITMVLMQWTSWRIYKPLLLTSGLCVLISLVIYVISGVAQINRANEKKG